MIYLDTSVALAYLLAEDRVPPDRLWEEDLVCSRLLEYELWTRIHAKKLTRSHGEAVQSILGRVAMLEMIAPVLARAVDPFPSPVRTLDALHLATVEFLREMSVKVELASYDARMIAVARKLKIPIYRV
ncbi:MAG TPA: PIN domain-containing protein [Acidobacteriota bacterium]